MKEYQEKIHYYHSEISKLGLKNNTLIEFQNDQVGVFLDESKIYYAYFLQDSNITCNGLCLLRDCAIMEPPVMFSFLTPLDCARFIVLNMLPRRNQITFLFDKDVL